MNTTPLSTEDIAAIRDDLKANGLSRIVNMRVNKQQYAAGSISLYPSIATKANSYRWTEREFPLVFAFVLKHKLSAISGTDYYEHDLGHVGIVYGSGFAFVARKA
jgi:hypothetical protein